MAGLTRIDPASWQVTVLAPPKRFTRGKALGFCAGHPVGLAENARAKVVGCWWPGGVPELLALEGRELVRTGSAQGRCIVGSWRTADGEGLHAAAWRWGPPGLVGRELHDARYERTWATATDGGDLVAGIGMPMGRPGSRDPNVGLVWRGEQLVREVRADSAVQLQATDGRQLGGVVGRDAAHWPTLDADAVSLAPKGSFASSVHALDGARQYGESWKGSRSRAARWEGSAASFVDLTPEGCQVGGIRHAMDGLQVGWVRHRETVGNGTPSLAYRAAVWEDSSDRWADLNEVLPTTGGFNASSASAILVEGGVVRVCGSITRYEVHGEGTDRESHVMPEERAAVWTARLT